MKVIPVMASGVVCKGPCLVYSICGIGLAQTDNTYTIYDGQGTDGKHKWTLVAAAYQADFRLFAAPVLMAKGLYVDFTTHGEEVDVQYLEINP
jgi:hypothetical protein